MSLSQVNSSKLSMPAWVSLLVYAGLIGVAFLIWQSLDVPARLTGDALVYWEYAQNLIAGHYDAVLSTFRPYGYPVLLAIFIKLSLLIGMTSPYPIIFACQFAIHIATASLATLIVRRFTPVSRSWVLYMVFAAVAWHPYLLSMVTQILTENVSVFWMTLFFYAFQAELLEAKFAHRALVGAALGFGSVTRPLNLVWSIGVLLFLIVVVYIYVRVRRRWFLKAPLRRLAQITVCFVLVVLTQRLATSYFTLNAQNPNAVYADESTGALVYNLRTALYTYRGETLYINDDVLPVWHYNERLRPNFLKPEAILMPFVKTVSLFQEHDFKSYRPVLGIVSAPAFAIGLIGCIMFFYVIPQSLQDIWKRAGQAIPIAGLLTVLMASHVFLYAIFTIADPRYIFSVYPILISLFAYYAQRASSWRQFLIPLCLAVIAYGLTTYTLLIAFKSTLFDV
jgi:hypothetical protein